MSSLVVVTFCCMVAMAWAGFKGPEHYEEGYYDRGYDAGSYGGNSGRKDSYYGGYREYGYGFKRTGRGIEAVYNNAARQQRVNQIAEHVGAGTGTAYRYGVSGTGNYFPNDRYGHHGGYSDSY